jgi:hypothetical protein
MEGNREQSGEQARFESEGMGWGPWGPGPWGWGPRGPGGRGPWGHGPWGRRGRGPWGFGGPFGGGPFGGGFGPGVGGPFGEGFGPESRTEWNALLQVGFDILRLLRAGVLASGGDTARLGRLRGILERTRDELNGFLGQGGPGGTAGTSTSGSPTGDGPTSMV